MAVSAAVVTLALAVGAFTPVRAEILVQVNKSTQRMLVTVNGVKRYNWVVSTGREGLVTPNGVFHPHLMERMHISRQFGGEEMPYSIFFSSVAIHGTTDISRLGRPVSHGCVRLHPSHAATLYGLVGRDILSNTRIEIN
ncbi:MAG: L,D-transpeptidase [Bradyrhizobium sp.]|nr:L,D-transpeptidase [Bradyrhizobium sp.]